MLGKWEDTKDATVTVVVITLIPRINTTPNQLFRFVISCTSRKVSRRRCTKILRNLIVLGREII